MSGDQQLGLKPGAVSWREADGEIIVLDLRNSDYLGVNPAGRVLWTLLAEGTTADALIQALVTEFGITPDQAQADVRAFVDDARARDLLA